VSVNITLDEGVRYGKICSISIPASPTKNENVIETILRAQFVFYSVEPDFLNRDVERKG